MKVVAGLDECPMKTCSDWRTTNPQPIEATSQVHASAVHVDLPGGGEVDFF